jgi:hypothetical protein
MDYNKGAHLAKWQWDVMREPATFDGVFDKDEEGMEIIISLPFDKVDLDKYYEYINKMQELKIFKNIYDILDKSEEYISISLFKANLNNIQEAQTKYVNTNGYFLETSETKEYFWGFLKFYPGERSNPHKIVLFSSKNYVLSNKLVTGNAFRNPSTIFEEFFHAAHFLYLKNNNLYIKDSFFTQTELEVEIAQALVYYIMKKDETKYKDIINAAFDGYEFVRKTSSYEIDEEKEKLFQIIMTEKKLSDKTIEDYKEQIKKGFTKKKESLSGSYSEIYIEKLDWNLVFVKRIIEDAFK